MVDPIKRISRAEPSLASQVDSTLSIGSDANNAWVAARQSEINAALDDLENAAKEELARRKAEDEAKENDSGAHARQWGAPYGDADEEEAPQPEPTLSGESDRIGTQNFDEYTPFGTRVAIL